MDNASLDWSLVPPFLAVADTGSLSAAARQLGRSQPTLGRQIAALEDRLGVTLFHRQPRGLILTEAGAALLPAAREMAAASQRLALEAAGRDAALTGTVRITASEVVAIVHLPPIIAAIRAAEPGIEIELVPSDESRNLLYREADIAIRMYRPAQLDLVAQHIGDLPLAAYVAKSYVARRGMPTAATLMEHDMVGYDADPQIVTGFRNAGFAVDRHAFAVRCDHNLGYWELVRAGCGMGLAQTSIGDADPSVVRVDLGLPLPALPVWLTAHEAMRRTPRIRRVWEMLRTGLAPLLT